MISSCAHLPSHCLCLNTHFGLGKVPASTMTKRIREEGGVIETDGLRYLHGFGCHHSSEAEKGALPELGNTPQVCPMGLYAEQINGTAFTKARHANQKAWTYRIRPSADHGRYTKVTDKYALTAPTNVVTPEQIRWDPFPMPTTSVNFVQGMKCYCGAGDASMKAGNRIYLYACNTNMTDCSFASSDGDMLIVPEHGTLDIWTEFGKMTVPSGFICVIQRGIRFSVNVPSTGARGYICEVFDSHFELPPRGVIGANGLANELDFQSPTAAYEDRDGIKFTCYQKFCDELFTFEQGHSPFDVVAWHGNYVPYRYDLAKFCVVNTVSYDHLDPSIFCVLTAQTPEPGVPSCDFVIFPPRWMVADKTFRPPYYHKNCMSEFMGNIRGTYEAKTKGFLPGGGSLHSHMAAHGPEKSAFDVHSQIDLKPTAPNPDHLAFMFESYYTYKLTANSVAENRDQDYSDMKCWQGFKKNFVAPKKTE